MSVVRAWCTCCNKTVWWGSDCASLPLCADCKAVQGMVDSAPTVVVSRSNGLEQIVNLESLRKQP
jgi:hypothetical protein